MSEKTTKTTAQNPFFEVASAQLTQVNAMLDEVAQMQSQGIEQAKTALDEGVRLSREALAHWTTLAGESRRMTFDAMKRTFGLFQTGQSDTNA